MRLSYFACVLLLVGSGASATPWYNSANTSMCMAAISEGKAGISLLNSEGLRTVLVLKHPELDQHKGVFEKNLTAEVGFSFGPGGRASVTQISRPQSAISLQIDFGDGQEEFYPVHPSRLSGDDYSMGADETLLRALRRGRNVRLIHSSNVLFSHSLSGSSKAIQLFMECSETFGREHSKR